MLTAGLQMSLLGSMRVTHGPTTIDAKPTRTVQALLAYLVLNRHRYHPREVLAGLFWGEHSEDRARSCLNTTLYRLRHTLEPAGVPQGTYLISTSTGEVAFNCQSDHWLDVEDFEERTSRIMRRPVAAMDVTEASELANVLELYRGDLLEGFYDDWALRDRERLRLIYLGALARLMSYHKQTGAYEASLAYGRRILEHDPLREEVHRELMGLYAANGQRPLAVRQYEACCEILATELGISPMEETQALYSQILEGPVAPGISSRPPVEANREANGLEQAMRQLREAVQQFEVAQARLQRAVQTLAHYSETHR